MAEGAADLSLPVAAGEAADSIQNILRRSLSSTSGNRSDTRCTTCHTPQVLRDSPHLHIRTLRLRNRIPPLLPQSLGQPRNPRVYKRAG
jgi:hypothetical protein